MSRNLARHSRLCLFLAVAIVASRPVMSQTNSNNAGVILTATLLESITITALPAAVAFNLQAGGTADGSTPVSITTLWTLSAGRSNLKLYGSFDSSTAALNDGNGNNIPSANVLGQVTTGSPTTFTPFAQTAPFGAAGAALQLYSQTISLANLTGTRTDNLNLRIDLTNLPLPAGVYLGTLHIQAQAL